MKRTREMERFISDYSERGFRFACQLCKSAEEAKELVQESFFRVIRNWDGYDSCGNPESWFLTILRNVYYDSAKRYDRKRCVSLDSRVCEDEDLSSYAEKLPDSRDADALELLEREELASRTRSALDGLSPEYRAILTLCDMEGLGYEQIATVLDCPLGTVKSRVWRAREAFRIKFLELNQEVLEP